MSPRTLRSLGSLFVIVLGLVAATALTVKAFEMPAPADRAARWVTTVSEAQKARAADYIETLPNAYRSALYSALSAADRETFWRDRIRHYISRHAGLTKAQMAFLNDVDVLIKGGRVFGTKGTATAEELQAMRATGARGRALFPPDEVHYLLQSIGPKNGDDGLREPGLYRMVAWIANRVTLQARAAGACECSQASDWCGGGRQCSWPDGGCAVYGPPAPCDPPYGCGTFLCFMCDGTCGFPMQ
jgi:hypothetical protein